MTKWEVVDDKGERVRGPYRRERSAENKAFDLTMANRDGRTFIHRSIAEPPKRHRGPRLRRIEPPIRQVAANKSC